MGKYNEGRQSWSARGRGKSVQTLHRMPPGRLQGACGVSVDPRPDSGSAAEDKEVIINEDDSSGTHHQQLWIQFQKEQVEALIHKPWYCEQPINVKKIKEMVVDWNDKKLLTQSQHIKGAAMEVPTILRVPGCAERPHLEYQHLPSVKESQPSLLLP